MKDGICPQCRERNVFLDVNYNGSAGGIAVGLFKIIETKRFVCGSCGFVGIYVANDKDLARIAEAKDLKKIS